MPERVADAIEEIARPNRGDQQEKPQIQADPALRRPRLIRNTPAAVVAVLVARRRGGRGLGHVLGARPPRGVGSARPVDCGAACPSGLWPPPLLPSSSVGLLAWAFRPAQTLRRAARTWRYRVAPPHRAAFRCSYRSPQRSSSGSASPRWRHGRQRCGLRSTPRRRRPSTWSRRRCPRSRGGDRRRARGGVPTPKGHGASAIRAAIRRGVRPVGRFRHGGAYRRCVRDGRRRRRESGFRAAPAMHRCAVRLPAAALRPGLRRATTSASSSRPQRGRRHRRRPTSRRRGARRSARTTARSATRSFGCFATSLPARPTRAGPATTSTSPACCSRTRWFAGARFSGRHVWFDGARSSRPEASFDDANFNAEVVSFDGASFESDATFAGCDVSGPQRLVRRGRLQRQETRHSTRRGSPASTSRFDESASPASRRRSARRCSSACARRSTRPPSGRTSSSTGTTLSSGSQPAVPRCITPRPWPPYLVEQESGRAPAGRPEKDDDLDG